MSTTAAAIFVFLSLLAFAVSAVSATSLNNCPMATVKPIIARAAEAAGPEASLQMQVIRKIMEDLYGGSWGVLIVKDPHLVSITVHWTIPDHRHADGSSAFCLHVLHGWQYNVFKTGNFDTENRLTVEEVVRRLHEGKKKPQRLTVREFDRRIAEAFRKRRRLRTEDDNIARVDFS